MSTQDTVNIAKSAPTRAMPALTGPGYPPPTWAHPAGHGTPPPGGGWAPVPPPPARRSSGTWVTVVIGLMLVLAVAASGLLIFIAVREEPADVVSAAVEDAGKWGGVTYRGSVTDYQGVRIDYDLTVTAEGAKGTLSRDGGRAKAEVVQDRSGVLLKANKEWWQSRQRQKATQLADTWVTDPTSETTSFTSLLKLSPDALARQVGPISSLMWKQEREEVVDGKRAVVLTDGFRTAIVTADEPYRLLAIDVQPVGLRNDAPPRVVQATPEQVAEVNKAGAGIRAQSPKSLTQRLLERAEPRIKIQDAPPCQTQTCTFTVTVTNTGELAATGRLEITVDGRLAANHPLNIQPGQTGTFEASAVNPSFGRPGSRGTFQIRAYIVES
jgi:hypothetical protein